jgi:NADPH-dependent F420 reductase
MTKIAILGGTGNLGFGLARRWALAGKEIVIGSRTADKAEASAAELNELCASRGLAGKVSGAANLDAANAADIVVLTVPFSHQKPTLEEVKPALVGKILIDTTVPLVPPRVARVQLPAEGSAAQIAQATVGEDVKVVSAFQNVAADLLQSDAELDCDVLVTSDDKDARALVCTLVEEAGMRGFQAGALANSAAAEALTSLLIFINKQYSTHAGIRITGIGEAH